MLNINEIINATGGILKNGNKNTVPRFYEIDSRNITKESFFVPIKGENVDGHNYIIDSVKKGCSGYFIENGIENKDEIIIESIKINSNICIIEVEDTLKALIESGKYNRMKHIEIPIIAVTGSVGKTSTREMISSVLRQQLNVLSTKKNYNSNIGVSIMCLEIENQDVCVFEAGIDKFNEMEELSEIIKPDIVVMTLIGTSHIGTFKSKENIFKEKFKITNNLKGLKRLIVNGDDEILNKIDEKQKYETIKIHINDAKEIKSKENSITYKTKIYNENSNIYINQIGIHNIYNSLMAIKVGEILNIKKENIIKGIKNYKNFGSRLDLECINGITIIDDAYNASKESIKSGLETINKINSSRKIIIFGDVFDLGDMANDIHEQIAYNFININFDYLYTIGEKSKITAQKVKEKFKDKIIISFDDKENLLENLLKIIKKGDLIYFKASNGMKLQEMIISLKEKLKNQ